jgi:competence protein ComEC
MALDVRDGFAGNIRQAITEPEASLGIGYLLGQKSALPSDLVDALKVAGLTHIVVASGYNLTILVRIGRRLFAKISKYLAMLTGSGLIVGFVAMTGLSPSMTRAGLVAGLGLWAWYYGRKFHPITLLAVAASVTVLVNPSYVWGDLGWLLSFAAFAGVMIIAPIATAYFFGEGNVPFVGQLLIETISAQIATLPIMIMAFQQLSVIAPIANLLVLPIIPLVMLLVALAGVGVMVVPAFAGVIGWPAEQLLHIQIGIINWCADIPWALEKPEWQWWGVVLYAAMLTTIIMHMKFRAGYKLYTASIVE